MTSFAVLLGHQPRLTVAELAATVSDFSPGKTVRKIALTFESGTELGPKHMEKWGGTMLLARKVASGDLTLKDIPQILVNETEKTKGKVTFALRGIGVAPVQLRSLYRDCKSLLVKNGRAARYVGNEKQPAATVLLRDEGLIDGKHGCELLILQDEDFLWIGRTIAVQDADAYTKRDMEKPVRDTRSGLLPPKLAQIMLNLGEWVVRDRNPKSPKTLTVFDPFCGTGVIPVECLYRGWPVLASDSSLKAVNGCEKNLEWIRKEEEIKKSVIPSKVWKQDALKPFELKELPDVIVTETYLGPALTDRPTVKDAAKIKTEVENMQIGFLENAAATMPGVPIVLTLPVWYLRTDTVMLEKFWKHLLDSPYETALPPGAESDAPDRPSIIYRRPDQTVGREIVILRPKR